MKKRTIIITNSITFKLNAYLDNKRYLSYKNYEYLSEYRAVELNQPLIQWIWGVISWW